MDERWLTPLEFGRLFRLNKKTVYRLVHQGRVTALRVNKQWRVREPTAMQLRHALQTADPEEEFFFLKAREVASILGVSIARVRQYRHAGRLPAVFSTGRYPLYRLSDIRRLITERKAGRRVRRRGSSKLESEAVVELSLRKLAKPPKATESDRERKARAPALREARRRGFLQLGA